jgi:hypothetical protein
MEDNAFLDQHTTNSYATGDAEEAEPLNRCPIPPGGTPSAQTSTAPAS